MAYEIRPMSFGEILDSGFRLLRDHFRLLVGLAAVVYVPISAAGVAIGLAVPGAAAGADVNAALPAVLLIVAGVLVVGLIGWPVSAAAVTYAIGELCLGRPVSFGAALRVGFSLLLPMMGTSFLSMLFIGLGMVALIVPGVYLFLAYSLAWQVMVIERVFGMRALRRSRALMRGNLLRAAGILFVYSVLVSMPDWAIRFGLGAVPVAASLASAVVQAAGFAFLSAVMVVLYFDIRSRREAFDLEHLAELVEQRAAVPAPG